MGECRRSDVLRDEFRGSLSWSSYVRGQDLERREAGRPPGRATHQVRPGHQPQDRQGPRPDDPAVAPAAGGSGDRVAVDPESARYTLRTLTSRVLRAAEGCGFYGGRGRQHVSNYRHKVLK